jgi:hypothetical protein
MTTAEKLILKTFNDNCSSKGCVWASMTLDANEKPYELMLDETAQDLGLDRERVLEVVGPTVEGKTIWDIFP